MRFRTPLVTSYAALILLVLLLLGLQSMASELILSMIFAGVIIIQVLLVLIDNQFDTVHAFITGVAFISLVYLVINMMGPATITTFFLGAMFILLYLAGILLILINNWHQYRMFDRMIHSMSDKRQKPTPVVPVEALVDEPPHVRLRQNDDEEWVEIKVKKTTRKTARKASRKTAKKSTRKTAKKKTARKNSRRKR